MAGAGKPPWFAGNSLLPLTNPGAPRPPCSRALKDKGEIALLTGVPGAHNLEERIRGFKDGIAQSPNIRIVATAVSNDDINVGVQVVEEIMRAHPTLNGWFSVGMWPHFAERGSMPLWQGAVRRRGLEAVAFDTLPVELEFLRDGYLSALLFYLAHSAQRSWRFSALRCC